MRLIILVLVISLASCQILTRPQVKPKLSSPKLETELDVSSRITVKKDEFDKTTTISGPFVGAFVEQGEAYVLLVTFKKGDDVYHQVRVAFYGKEWLFLDRCVNESGVKCKKDGSHRDTIKYGGIQEHVFFRLDEPSLKSLASQGGRFKIYGSRGDFVVRIPPFYGRAFLSRLVSDGIVSNDK